MMTAVLVLHILVSVLLILVVLIQGGENVDITAAFGGVSQAAFGPRGAVTAMQKITWVLAAIFVITAVTLAVAATKSRGSSVLEQAPAKSAPANPAPAKSGPAAPVPAAPPPAAPAPAKK